MCVVLCVFSLRKLPGQFYAVSYISYYCNEWGILQDFDKQNIDFIFNFVNHKKKKLTPQDGIQATTFIWILSSSMKIGLVRTNRNHSTTANIQNSFVALLVLESSVDRSRQSRRHPNNVRKVSSFSNHSSLHHRRGDICRCEKIEETTRCLTTTTYAKRVTSQTKGRVWCYYLWETWLPLISITCHSWQGPLPVK